MTLKATLISCLFLWSCKSNKANDEFSMMAPAVVDAQLEYLDKRLISYSRISEDGRNLYHESLYLDSVATEFKDLISNQGEVSVQDRYALFDHFEKVFGEHPAIDFDKFNSLKHVAFSNILDVDYLRLYIKSNLVTILYDLDLLPFNSWSTMVSAPKSINYGEEFEIAIGNIAWNSRMPHKIFIAKDPSKDEMEGNILDTLEQNERGVFVFKTKNYKKGENEIQFFSVLDVPDRSNGVIQNRVTFTVK